MMLCLCGVQAQMILGKSRKRSMRKYWSFSNRWDPQRRHGEAWNPPVCCCHMVELYSLNLDQTAPVIRSSTSSGHNCTSFGINITQRYHQHSTSSSSAHRRVPCLPRPPLQIPPMAETPIFPHAPLSTCTQYHLSFNTTQAQQHVTTSS